MAIVKDLLVTGDVKVSGTIEGDLTGDVSGNASTATMATQDGSGNNIASTYLPLSGGTMTGDLYISGSMIKGMSTKGVNYIGGPTWGTCASLTLLDGTHATSPGYFYLRAISDGTTGEFIGKPDGTLTWNGLNVERVNSSGGNWIRYENGMQIHWGSISISSVPASSGASNTVTFTKSFSSAPYAVLTMYGGGNSYSHVTEYVGTTATTIFVNCWNNQTSSATVGGFEFLAIGWWK